MKLPILILNKMYHIHISLQYRDHYIDHVFISKDARNTVTACAIVSDLPSNVSDHFPMCTTLGVLVTSKELDIADNGVSSFPNFPRVDWSDNKNCTAYSRYGCSDSIS